MRVMSKSTGRGTPFNCDEWSRFAANTKREEVASGFVHDVYEAPFKGDFERAVDALLAYRIFAPSRMYARVCTPDRIVVVGATIIQRIMLGPVAIETAVKIIEVDRSADRASFAYATLRGHPERGIASFTVTRATVGGKFEAHAWSRSGHWLTILGRPVSRFLQRMITREARASFCARAGNSDAS